MKNYYYGYGGYQPGWKRVFRRRVSNALEIIGLFVVLAFFIGSLAYGLSKSLDNRCQYYQTLSQTEGIRNVCK